MRHKGRRKLERVSGMWDTGYLYRKIEEGESMFCRKCGSEVEEEWKVCPNCGNSLNDSSKSNEGYIDNSMKGAMVDTKPKKSRKKKIFVVIGIVLVVLIALLFLLEEDSDDKKEFVQTGYLGTYDTIEVQEVLEWYASDGEWGEGESKDSKAYIVEYKAKDFVLQFKLQEEEKKFHVSGLIDMGENITEAIDIKQHLDEIYSAYLSENPDSGIEVDTSLKCDTLQGYFGPVKKNDGKIENEKIANMDFAELIGKSESDLKKIGLKESDEYIGYGALGGDVCVSCTDGKVDMIMITGSEKATPSFHGVRIGMDEKEAYEKLSKNYDEEVDLDGKFYVNLENKGMVRCKSEDGKISGITYMTLTDDMIAEYGTQEEEILYSEYVFLDSDKKYLSEEEVRSVEIDRLFIGRNEIFARHGYIFQDANLQQHFENTSWYKGTIPNEQFNMEELFNDFEKKNVELIKKVENEINGTGNDQEEEDARIEAGKQEAINAAYNEVVGKKYHLQDAQRMIEFTGDGQFIYSISSFEDNSCGYSFSAEYALHRDEMQYLVLLHIEGVDYYFRFFTDGKISLEGAGEFEGWYEPI